MHRAALCTAALLLAAGNANAEELLYHNDFEQGPLGPEWSSGRSLASEGVFTRFNGRYTNSATILRIGAVQPPPGGWPGRTFAGKVNAGAFVGGVVFGGGGGGGDDGGGDGGGGDGGDGGDGGGGSGQIHYTLSFDFYAIDSWDGDSTLHGPDRFEVRINKDLVFSETFANAHTGQSFRDPDLGRQHLGFNPNWVDAIYRDITIDFTLPQDAETLRVDFYAMGLQAEMDESWGIDNVAINYSIIPAPATLSAAGLGLLLAGRRRR